MGIVTKICALLQTFLPILENRELLTYVMATKSMTQIRDMSMTIYYSEQINIGISTKITSFKKKSWNVELNGGIFIHIACIEAQQRTCELVNF